MLLIYFDVCCLNRPFDDQGQDRIRLEAEAVLLILGRCEAREWQWVSSAIVEEEVNRIPNTERRYRIKAMLKGTSLTVALTDTTVARAREITALGFRTYDALHLACAEQAGAEVLLTSDDDIIRTAARNAERLKVRVANPLNWILEVSK